MHPQIFPAQNSALVIVDMQENLRRVIPDFERVLFFCRLILRAFNVLKLPVIVTEQYPKGLGPTVPELSSEIPGFTPVLKNTASAWNSPDFSGRLNALGVRTVALCGIESHVCVSQTAHDLLANGIGVHAVADALGARHALNERIGLDKMLRAGAVPSSVETLVLEMVTGRDHPHFRDIQVLFKEAWLSFRNLYMPNGE